MPNNYPRYAIFRKRRVRVLEYAGNNSFWVLDSHDERRLVSKSQLTFIKEAKK